MSKIRGSYIPALQVHNKKYLWTTKKLILNNMSHLKQGGKEFLTNDTLIYPLSSLYSARRLRGKVHASLDHFS